MPASAILFDLDGTLLDSIGGILFSFRHVLGLHVPKKVFSDRDLIMTIGEPVAKQMLDFAGGDSALAAQMVLDYRVHHQVILPQIPLFAGARETLLGIQGRGQKLGVVTSKGSQSAMLSLEVHGLVPLLDVIITADDTVRHKPDPMPLRVATERLGLRCADVVYVGDSVHDVRCALAAGCVAAAALWGPFERATLAALGPQFMVETLADLMLIPELMPG